MSYIVPIHCPTSIRHAVKLQFLEPGEDSLIVAKANRLEIYSLGPEGLVFQHAESIYGNITILQRIARPASSRTDHLLVAIDRFGYFTLSWNPSTRSLRTIQEYVDLADPSSRPAQFGDRCLVDPSGTYMTLEMYEGIITIIPIVKEKERKGKRVITNNLDPSLIGELEDPVQARIEELMVKSSAFLDDGNDDKNTPPRLAFLYEDTQNKVRLKVRGLKWEPGLDMAELNSTDVATSDLDASANLLIPVPQPLGGLLVLAETTIWYIDEAKNETICHPLEEPTVFSCWEQVDGQRWLLADEYGRLFFLMLVLDASNTDVENWKIDYLGQTSQASVMVYLGDGVTFIGSHQGDSQVIRITERSFEIVQTFTNLAPILDFTIMDLGNRGENQTQTNEFSSGQARIVTGSGAFTDGSLRSVRSGVGMEELGVLGSIEHSTDLFALRSSCSSEYSNTLLVSFVNETRAFQFSPDGEVEEKEEYLGLDLSESTILAANLPTSRIIQVTESKVRICDTDSGVLLWEWAPITRQVITAASANDDYLVLVVGGDKLMAFSLGGEPNVSGEMHFDTNDQVSGVTVSSSPGNACILCHPQTATVMVIDLKDMRICQTKGLGEPGEAVPRSVLVAEVLPDSPATLFISMADGNVFSFSFHSNDFTLDNMTKLVLGSEQPFFKKLPRGNGLYNVFVTCEQPSLIYASDGRLLYSAVDSDRATRICHFNSEAFPGSIALATPSELKIAVVDPERTTQVQSLHVGETVRRIAYSSLEKAFGIGTIRRELKDCAEVITSHFMLADEIMFQKLHVFDLNTDELVESVITVPFPNGTDGFGKELFRNVFVVGTAYMDPLGERDTRGRILMFEVSENRQLNLVHELAVKGACRSLALVEGRLAAALVKSVVIFEISVERFNAVKLIKKCAYRTSTAPIDILATGNILAVADVMKSVSLVEYKQGKNGLPDFMKEIARHYQTLWSTAVSPIGDNRWLESDAEGNLVVLQRNVNGVTDDDRRRLNVISEMLLGEMTNRIRPVNIHTPPSSTVIPKAFLATVEGSIYLFGEINDAYQDFFMRLQASIASLVISVGDIPFNRFRAFRSTMRQAEEPFRFVDGELIERFLKCEPGLQKEIVDSVNAATTSAGSQMTVSNVKDIVERLRRMH